jgi:3',5'-cyclic AMP phosphodiesterase CpdA
MLKAIWMSDPHFTAVGEVLGHDPKARLSAAVKHVAEHHPDSAFTIISGDLVNRGTPEDYNVLKPYLDNLPCPYYPMAGNHDDRTLIKRTFDLPPDYMDDFIQYSVPTPEGLILCLDTQKSGSDAGEFCTSRTEWLRDKLEAAQNTPVFIFMHHPPMPLGLPMQDTDRLENGEAFLDLIAHYPNVKHLFIGHVHRPITGTIRGIPYATMRSVLYQAPAPKPDWDWDSFEPAQEAPNLGIITLNNADVCLHYTQFCEYTVGT